jgi:hypothetical protein
VSLVFLTNYAGQVGSGMSAAGFAGTDTGFDAQDVISGPRSTLWKSAAATTERAVAYEFTSPVTCDYFVVARADKLLTKNTSRVRLLQKSAVGAWTYVSGVDYFPLLASHLVGIRSQDLVFAASPSQFYGYALESDQLGATAESMLVSKFYGCSSFSFDRPLKQDPSFEDVGPKDLATPLRATGPYAVEKRLRMTFENVSAASLAAFKALPRLRSWPLFIYDSTGVIWPWRLEHVLVDGWDEAYVAPNQFTLSLSFLRLRHDY